VISIRSSLLLALVLALSAPGTTTTIAPTPSQAPNVELRDLTRPDCDGFRSTDVDRLTEEKWRHLEAPHHQWQRFGYITRGQIAAALTNAFSTGRRSYYGMQGSACQAQVIEESPSGTPAFITVTYRVVGSTARIGSAWATDINCAYPCSGGP
jgi:hypothetical protein